MLSVIRVEVARVEVGELAEDMVAYVENEL
jgi:hypothetical protein